MAETNQTTSRVTAAGPDAAKEQQQRVSSWFAQTHDLLDEYGIARMTSGENRGETRWLSLPERTQLLHERIERWRQRAFRAEKRFEDKFTEPDSAGAEPEETNHG